MYIYIYMCACVAQTMHWFSVQRHPTATAPAYLKHQPSESLFSHAHTASHNIASQGIAIATHRTATEPTPISFSKHLHTPICIYDRSPLK